MKRPDGCTGEFYTDEKTRRLYATDASAYRELPLAVAVPKSEQDVVLLVRAASQGNFSLIPRTAGTSLAGQVVGSGVVVDISKYLNQVLELNVEEGWVKVQPGIVRDDLNKYLAPHGYFFAPETSTANRAMIGGMIGNNSCGSNSVVYGSTREHLLEVKTVLSDASVAEFGPLDTSAFLARCNDKINEVLAIKTPKALRTYAQDLLNRIEKDRSLGNNKERSMMMARAGKRGALRGIVRASELASPAPKGHVLQIFGQSDRELLDSATKEANATQVLSMLNGEVEKLVVANSQSQVYRLSQGSVQDRIRALFFGTLSRSPSEAEMALMQAEVAARQHNPGK